MPKLSGNSSDTVIGGVLHDDEASLDIKTADDIEEISNYMQAFRFIRETLRNESGLPISGRPLCGAHQLLLNGVRGTGKQLGELRNLKM